MYTFISFGRRHHLDLKCSDIHGFQGSNKVWSPHGVVRRLFPPLDPLDVPLQSLDTGQRSISSKYQLCGRNHLERRKHVLYVMSAWMCICVCEYVYMCMWMHGSAWECMVCICECMICVCECIVWMCMCMCVCATMCLSEVMCITSSHAWWRYECV